MTDARYNQLMNCPNEAIALTPEEMAEGWHFCCEFDGLLIGPEMKEEMEICSCELPPKVNTQNVNTE
jgi:hypothetical protein